MGILQSKSWSPHWAGAAIGGLETMAMLTAKRPLGVTSAFEEAAAFGAEKFAPEAMEIEKYKEAKGEAPKIDWEWGLVAGVTLGSYLSARMADDRQSSPLPDPWCRSMGGSQPLRYAAAFGGGALMMFGARMAKGCTSGHGISGTMQFSASSWLFDAIIFSTGIAISKLLHGRRQ